MEDNSAQGQLSVSCDDGWMRLKCYRHRKSLFMLKAVKIDTVFQLCADPMLNQWKQGSGTLMTMLYKEKTKTWDTCNWLLTFLNLSVSMWAVIPLAKDIDFSWILWYWKCPRSFSHWLVNIWWECSNMLPFFHVFMPEKFSVIDPLSGKADQWAVSCSQSPVIQEYNNPCKT